MKITNVITIPKKLAQKDDLVVLPRKEYERFLDWQENIRMFKPTPAQKRALKKAREDYKKGNFITIDELGRKLGFKS